MNNLSPNPFCKDYYMAKACVVIPRRYNYAGRVRSYHFPYLSFKTWSLSYRAAFCYVLKRLEDAVIKDESQILSLADVCDLFIDIDVRWSNLYFYLEENLGSHFRWYFYSYTPAEKLSFVYSLLDSIILYNLGEFRRDYVLSMFEIKSAIRYAASKYFPNTPFIEIESDFLFQDIMD